MEEKNHQNRQQEQQATAAEEATEQQENEYDDRPKSAVAIRGNLENTPLSTKGNSQSLLGPESRLYTAAWSRSLVHFAKILKLVLATV